MFIIKQKQLEKQRRFRKRFPLRCFGLSNIVTLEELQLGSLQYYDFDGQFSPGQLKKIIQELFPNDCLVFKTERGTHFWSLTIQTGLETVQKANSLSEQLNQDFKGSKMLILRTSPKYLDKNVHSDIPKFEAIISLPRANSLISLTHLRYLKDFLNLTEEIYEYYESNCILMECDLVLLYYYSKLKGQ